MKKILSILLALVIVLSFNTISFADDGSANNLQSEIYKEIKFDYTYLTKVDENVADAYFESIQSSEGVEANDEASIEEVLSLEEMNLEEIVIHLQHNYDEICSTFDSTEKENLDKYFLRKIIDYYLDNDQERQELKKLYDLSALLSDSVEPSTRAATVCKLTVFSDISTRAGTSSGHDVGLGAHSWLMFKNTSASSIKVGGLSVAAGKSVTIGTWGTLGSYKGAWYNYEAICIKEGKYNKRYSKSIDISSSTLTTLNTLLKSFDSWTLTANCSAYARIIWNRSGGTILSSGVVNTPMALANSIKSTDHYNYNASCVGTGKVYYNATTPTRYPSLE